jgi:hypothetical protein
MCARRCSSMKVAPGVDDDGLAGHGLGAAHRNHHVGAVSLSAAFFSSEPAAETATISGRRFAVARVPSAILAPHN